MKRQGMSGWLWLLVAGAFEIGMTTALKLEQQDSRFLWVFLVCAVALFVARAHAQPSALAEADFFEAQVRPLLVERCLECHGDKKQEAGLRLDSRAGWQIGGDRGPAVVTPRGLHRRAERPGDGRGSVGPAEGVEGALDAGS